MQYLYNKGAYEIWALIFLKNKYSSQKKRLLKFKNNFIGLPMEDEILISNKYFDEASSIITKSSDKVEFVQKNLIISTIINTAKEVGFYIDTILEEETVLLDDVNGYKSTFWRKEKIINCPSTLILKLKKILK